LRSVFGAALATRDPAALQGTMHSRGGYAPRYHGARDDDAELERQEAALMQRQQRAAPSSRSGGYQQPGYSLPEPAHHQAGPPQQQYQVPGQPQHYEEPQYQQQYQQQQYQPQYEQPQYEPTPQVHYQEPQPNQQFQANPQYQPNQQYQAPQQMHYEPQPQEQYFQHHQEPFQNPQQQQQRDYPPQPQDFGYRQQEFRQEGYPQPQQDYGRGFGQAHPLELRQPVQQHAAPVFMSHTGYAPQPVRHAPAPRYDAFPGFAPQEPPRQFSLPRGPTAGFLPTRANDGAQSLKRGRDEKRPGDWSCPKCGFNCFASKTSCPKCSTLQPREVSACRPSVFSGGPRVSSASAMLVPVAQRLLLPNGSWGGAVASMPIIRNPVPPTTHPGQKIKDECRFFNMRAGCKRGAECHFAHVAKPKRRSESEAPKVRLSLHKILFHFKAVLRESSVLSLPSPHLQRLPYCNTSGRPLRNIRPATDPPCVCHTPYNLGDGNIV